jgi:hypothetical protein
MLIEEQVEYEEITLQEDKEGDNTNIEDTRELLDMEDNNE